MKKFKILMALVGVISLIILTGCNSTEVLNDDSNIRFGNNPVNASIAHGSPTGLWFMLASGIGESLGRTYDGSLLQLSPGDNYPNFLRINEHTMDFALTLTNTVYKGYNGLGQFDEKHDNVGGIAVFYPSMLQFIVKKDTGIKTFEDFIERKVPLKFSIGIKGGSAHTALQDVLAEYDLNITDLEDWGCRIFEKGIKDTGELYSDGVIDGLWLIAGAPTPIVVQMGVNDEMVMLELPNALMSNLKNKYGFSDYLLPSASYNFQVEAYSGVCVYTMLTASLEVSEEVAYKTAKSIYENTEYFNSIHAALKRFSQDNILEGMPIPLHPGAELFYEEIGIAD
ncbi:MAG: TAXI family TRAP transporter solute-binding subunit [Clostridiales bacterium]|nr:TAXI family TRAP transporter solute-binding subunit [Clostridiales bacterium]